MSNTTLRGAQQKVREFHEKFGFAVDLLQEYRAAAAKPTDHNANAAAIEWYRIGVARSHLINQELSELLEAWESMDSQEIADGLGDLLYVVLGTAVAAGVNIAPIFDEIHRSNMTKDISTKLHPTKGEDYSPPNLTPILAAQGLLR